MEGRGVEDREKKFHPFPIPYPLSLSLSYPSIPSLHTPFPNALSIIRSIQPDRSPLFLEGFRERKRGICLPKDPI